MGTVRQSGQRVLDGQERDRALHATGLVRTTTSRPQPTSSTNQIRSLQPLSGPLWKEALPVFVDDQILDFLGNLRQMGSFDNLVDVA